MTYCSLLLSDASREGGIFELSKLEHEFGSLRSTPRNPDNQVWSVTSKRHLPLSPCQITLAVQYGYERGTCVAHVDDETVTFLLSVESEKRVDTERQTWRLI
jgi:hypothetical protein